MFSVENLNLQGAAKHALILNGGAVETTLNQIFVGEGEKAAVGIEQKDPSTPNGLIGDTEICEKVSEKVYGLTIRRVGLSSQMKT